MSPAPAPRVFLWRYRENRRNYPGYHLTADPAGTERLLAVLRRHEHASRAIESSVGLSAVTPPVLAVPGNTRGDASVVSLATLQMVTDPAFNQGHFEFRESHPVCRLALSRQQAAAVAGGVEDIQRGKGDYCIGGEGDEVLWFWWFAGA